MLKNVCVARHTYSKCISAMKRTKNFLQDIFFSLRVRDLCSRKHIWKRYSYQENNKKIGSSLFFIQNLSFVENSAISELFVFQFFFFLRKFSTILIALRCIGSVDLYLLVWSSLFIIIIYHWHKTWMQVITQSIQKWLNFKDTFYALKRKWWKLLKLFLEESNAKNREFLCNVLLS